MADELFAEVLRKTTAEGLERKRAVASRREAIEQEVRNGIAETFKRDYAPLLKKAAEEGKTTETLWIDPVTDSDDPDISGVRGKALIAALTSYMEGQQLGVENIGTDNCSHSRSPEIGLLVAWL